VRGLQTLDWCICFTLQLDIGMNFTDAGIAHLSGLSNSLHGLDTAHTAIWLLRLEQLIYLKSLSLHSLDMTDCPLVTDADARVAHMSSLPLHTLNSVFLLRLCSVCQDTCTKPASVTLAHSLIH
jgi:hypothetical protein